MAEHFLYYDLSEKADAAFDEAQDAPFIYLLDHLTHSFKKSSYTQTEYVIQGGQEIAIMTDPAMDLTLIWLKDEIGEVA